MKTCVLFLITFLLNCTAGFSQEVTIEVKDDQLILPKDGVYMLDSVAAVNRNYQFAFDRKDGFVQIYQDYATVSYTFRGENVLYSGKINNRKTADFNGTQIHMFTVVTDNRYFGVRPGTREFLGISYDGDKATVYELDVYKIPAVVFKTHMASQEEIKEAKRLK